MIALKRILLVEDKAKDVELTLGALEEHRLANEVVVVRDGVEALDYLQARGKFAGRSGGNPAVALLDIKMPRMDGLEVLRRVKADPQLKKMPIVILTSSREEPDLTEAYELGVNAYVVKPVEFQQFTDAVKQVGAFWAILNELPPDVGRKETSGQNGGDISPGKNESQK
jgi:CheY-like chemotaxis protein